MKTVKTEYAVQKKIDGKWKDCFSYSFRELNAARTCMTWSYERIIKRVTKITVTEEVVI